MDKRIAFIIVLGVFNSLFSQTDLPSVRGFRKNNNLHRNINESGTQVSIIKKDINTVANTNKTSAVSALRFTGSMNAFGVLVSESKPLNYYPALNAVTFIHRKSLTYTPTSNGNSGSIVGMYTTNNGTTWDSTCIWASGSDLARYPQGGLYNPLGNTNVNNAYMLGMGPVTNGTTWTGNWYASKHLFGGGTATPGMDQQVFLNGSSSIKKHHFSRYSFTSIEGGLVRSMATILNDPDATTLSAYGVRGAAMVKGQFNAGAFVWSVDSFIPPVETNIPGNYKYLNETALQAWNTSGTVGYVVMLGVRTGGTIGMRSYQPIVYKTTNSGASWTLLPANDFTTGWYTQLMNRIWPITTSSTTRIPYFSTNEGWDVTVDFSDNLHIACTVLGAYSSHMDSLDYNYAFGTQQYDYPYTGSFRYPTIYDFRTGSSGGWQYVIVDSMGTEGPSGVSGNPGYNSNVWIDGSGGKLDLSARIQMSKSSDGKKIIYTWTESDSTIVGLKWNIYPDIQMKGIDFSIGFLTPRINVSSGVAKADYQSYFHYTSPVAIGNSSVSLEVPLTISHNFVNDGGIPVDHYYLKGASIAAGSFSVYACPLLGSCAGIKEDSNNLLSDLLTAPNPTNDLMMVKFNSASSEMITLNIMDISGRIIKEIKFSAVIGENEVKIQTEELSQGMYLLNLSSSKENRTVRIIKN